MKNLILTLIAIVSIVSTVNAQTSKKAINLGTKTTTTSYNGVTTKIVTTNYVGSANSQVYFVAADSAKIEISIDSAACCNHKFNSVKMPKGYRLFAIVQTEKDVKAILVHTLTERTKEEPLASL